MTLNRLARALVRYFGGEATEVPPENKPTTELPANLQELFMKRLESLERSAAAMGRLEDIPGWDDRRQAPEPAEPAPAPGRKPPPDPLVEGWQWTKWAAEMKFQGTIPGWSFCRFANRLGEDGVAFVFGYVRSGFGVWPQPFTVRSLVNEGFGEDKRVLMCLTHLHSGTGLGIFDNRTIAIKAAELAEKVIEEHQTMDTMVLHNKMLPVWTDIGIIVDHTTYACDDNGNRYQINCMSWESVNEGRPEKLS